MTDLKSWSVLADILGGINLGPIPAGSRRMRTDPSIRPKLDHQPIIYSGHQPKPGGISEFVSRALAELKSSIEHQYWETLEGIYSLEACGGFPDRERQCRWAMACERLFQKEYQRILRAAAADNAELDVSPVLSHHGSNRPLTDSISSCQPSTILDQAFAHNAFPTASERAILSQSTGLDYKRVSPNAPA